MTHSAGSAGPVGSYKDAFKGTAWYYAKYRRPYPVAFFDLLNRAFHLDGSGRLLDLGCGTGQIAVPLAGQFAEVVAMDPEPEMLREAQRSAAGAGVVNITLVQGGSSDLDSLQGQLGTFRLVTMGSSFHWMDRESTLASLAKMVVPGGGLVVASAGSLWTNGASWCRTVKETVQMRLGEERRAGSSTYRDPLERHEAIIDRSRFGPCQTHIQRYEQVWTIEGITGYLYSTSFCSPYLLGERREAFEKDLRESLLKMNPEGRFVEEVCLEVHMGFLK